ncbi:MAG: adaptor protein MecA [Clostridium sp.]|jgi:adapter protein MecA 1/2|nr:adaptor protein MecA [Clostridium sp.]
MKIEKVNDNQIRCTLTREDLASRQLKISELAYGTEKAKNLFRDMMQQANFEFGFEAEDIPLMIEAIPMNAECIVLIITKVEDPDELDTRFSRFAPSVHDMQEQEDDIDADGLDGSEDVMELFRRLQENRRNETDTSTLEKKVANKTRHEKKSMTRAFRFESLRPVLDVSRHICVAFTGKSSLYKDSMKGGYLLVLSPDKMNVESFLSLSNVVCEYGSTQKLPTAGNSYISEHYERLIHEKAIQVLSKV